MPKRACGRWKIAVRESCVTANTSVAYLPTPVLSSRCPHAFHSLAFCEWDNRAFSTIEQGSNPTLAHPVDRYGCTSACCGHASVALSPAGTATQRREIGKHRARAAERNHSFASQRNAAVRTEPPRAASQPTPGTRIDRLDRERRRSGPCGAARPTAAKLRRK